MHYRQDRQLDIRAIEMAVWQREGEAPIVVHLDRGSQFMSFDYPRFLKANNLVSSMSAVGHSGDNVACEGFFGLLKRDRINHKRHPTRDTARADVFKYVEMFHNPRMRRRVAKQALQYAVYSDPSEKTGENPRKSDCSGKHRRLPLLPLSFVLRSDFLKL